MLADSLKELTADFKLVSYLEYNKISKYYPIFSLYREYPRFFMSLLYLTQSKDYYYGIVNDCLCIIKKKMIGYPIVYLVIPPIHKNGDPRVESDTLKLFNKVKIKTRLSEEDLKLYDIDLKLVTRDKDLDEFIYDIKEAILLEGGNYSQFRRYKRKYTGYTECFPSSHIKNDIILNAKELNETWSLYKERDYNGNNDCHVYDDTISSFIGLRTNNIKFTGLVDNGLICYDLSENVGEGVIITTRYFNYYHPKVNNSVYILHNLTCSNWQEYKYANFGSCVGNKELYESKSRLKPCKILELYNFKYQYKFTKEEYDSICPVKNFWF